MCPPRDVRNFRVLFMKDAHTNRRPSHRTAEVTVWDVLSLSFDEGREPGTFKEGQRFLVSAPPPLFSNPPYEFHWRAIAG